MNKIYKILLFNLVLFQITSTASALEVPNQVQDWMTEIIQAKSIDIKMKITTFPSVESKLTAVTANMHIWKLDSFVKISLDTLDIIQTPKNQLSIDNVKKEINIYEVTEQERMMQKAMSDVQSIINMLSMYDTVYISAHTNTSTIYSFLGKNLPYYNKCDLDIDNKTKYTKSCTFYFTDQKYYEKTEIIYENVVYNTKIEMKEFMLENYIDMEKKIGKNAYKEYKVIEN